MNYGLIYKLPFKSIDDDDCVVEILKESYTGKVTELTGSGDSTFCVEIDDDDFLYTPLRFSKATIRVVGNDYLQELYSTGYQQYKVDFRKNGTLIWTGFIVPEIYTQDYTSEDFTLDIQCTSAMGILEYIPYESNAERREYTSLWQLIKKCISLSRGSYYSVFIPHVYGRTATTYNQKENVLEEMLISEFNFFDEEDVPMTYKEILEEICKFLNWSCIDYLGDLYFIDPDYRESYFKYNAINFVKTGEESAGKNKIGVQDISFAGSTHTLDILGGYNKVTVKTSNYNINKIFPEEDFDQLIEYDSFFESGREKNNKRKVSSGKIYLGKEYKLYNYRNTAAMPLVDPETVTVAKKEVLGGFLVKRCIYDENYKNKVWVPAITNYNYEYLIRVRCAGTININKNRNVLPDSSLIMEFSRQLPVAMFSDGAIAIQCSIQGGGQGDLASWGDSMDAGSIDTKMLCAISIGSNYWDGTSKKWTEKPATFTLTFDGKKLRDGGFVENQNTKTLDMPYSGLDGYIIDLPDNKPLFGEMKFKMYTLKPGKDPTFDCGYVSYFIKDLKMTYQLNDKYMAACDNQQDRMYENVVNEDYINELEGIEFKISSYNNDGVCYGKVILKDVYLTDNLYSIMRKKYIRPEELLIERIINQYKTTKIKLTQEIRMDNRITPFTLLTDKYMRDKEFLVTGGEIDYKLNQFKCKMTEYGNN